MNNHLKLPFIRVGNLFDGYNNFLTSIYLVGYEPTSPRKDTTSNNFDNRIVFQLSAAFSGCHKCIRDIRKDDIENVQRVK